MWGFLMALGADPVEQEIIKIVASVAVDGTRDRWKSDRIWTSGVKRRVSELGRDKGFRSVATAGLRLTVVENGSTTSPGFSSRMITSKGFLWSWSLNGASILAISTGTSASSFWHVRTTE